MLKQFGLLPTNSKMVLVGSIFSRLKVIQIGEKSRYRYFAICKCECGSDSKLVRADHLVSGKTLSCGCLQKEKSTTHGLTKSIHYDRWKNMIDRCENLDNSSYSRYGGRGIKVCKRWHDLAVFVKDLPPGYFAGAEIDRKDNDGNYEPSNVRWSTKQENCSNRRGRRDIEFKGEVKSLTEWSSQYNLPVPLIWGRLNAGWTVESAFTTSAIEADARMATARYARWGDTKQFMLNGDPKTIAELSMLSGLPEKLLRQRLCEKGWSIERAMLPKEEDKTVMLDGKQYTIAQLSDRTGISKALLRKRIFERGWSIEKATR